MSDGGQLCGDTEQLWLYLEEGTKEKPLVHIAPDNILLFFKLYDPKRQMLSYLGRCYAWDTNKLPGPPAILVAQSWVHRECCSAGGHDHTQAFMQAHM